MRTTLLLIPGLACDGFVWSAQRAALADVADVLIAEHGRLDTLGAMAEAMLARAHGRFAVAGHSMGGRVALEIFRRAPERVLGLALLDTGYREKAPGDAGAREIEGRRQLVEIARAAGMREMGRAWVQNMVYSPRLNDRVLIDGVLDMIERKPVEVFEAQVRALLSRPDATHVLETIDCPALILCGQDDKWAPPQQHREMAELVRASTYAVIPECGHMSTLERPEAVSAALRAWLKAV